jgi:hypothetical protein
MRFPGRFPESMNIRRAAQKNPPSTTRSFLNEKIPCP